MEPDAQRHGDLRGRLLEAGQEVFAASGYASATIDDIIGAAGTSRATFYRYFRSKEDLFDELSRACFREMRALVRKLTAFEPSSDGRDGLEELVSVYCDLQVHQRGVIRAWMERVERPESPVRREAANTFYALLSGLEKPISAMGVPSRVDPQVQAALLFIVLDRATFYVLHRHSRITPQLLPPTLATMIHRAWLGAGSEGRGRQRASAGG